MSFEKKKKKQLWDKGLYVSKKIVFKTGEYLGNKIAATVTKSNNDNIENPEPVEEIITPREK